MKIRIYTGNFYPEKTGIGKYTGELAAWLVKHGHAVTVVTGFPYYPEWKLSGYSRTRFLKEQWQGVEIQRVPHYIPRDGKVSSLKRMLVDLTIFCSSGAIFLKQFFFRQERADITICICPPLFSGIWGALGRLFFGTPWIYHIQDFQVDAALKLNMLRGRFLATLLLGIERKLIQSADHASSITPSMCKRLVAKGADPSKVLHLPNWSDLNNIQPIDKATPFRASLGINEPGLLVMYAGAMGNKQGLPLVLDAAERLLDDLRFHFVMVGTGSDAEALQDAARARNLRNMTFMPLQPIERLNEMLGSADIHLVIQKSDAADLVMPSKLTNILAAGRPTIATADKGTELWDVIVGASTGIAIPPEDLEAFIEALHAMAASAENRIYYGVRAREFAEHNLGQDAILGRFEKALAISREAAATRVSA